ncbi:hypothetical protein BHM03_00004327 [Ensete ventricosum]|uniref:Uncharacterized protein n=1 Tax=Ensete ventricosum TaxID=4639 RepID=A0A445MAK3_ENSVE|nr:hypothetical protein BHM03_00004327 [Ensete ventricosum]
MGNMSSAPANMSGQGRKYAADADWKTAMQFGGPSTTCIRWCMQPYACEVTAHYRDPPHYLHPLNHLSSLTSERCVVVTG